MKFIFICIIHVKTRNLKRQCIQKNYYNYICVYVQPVNIIFITRYESYYLIYIYLLLL
jgi:hypothetical protein